MPDDIVSKELLDAMAILGWRMPEDDAEIAVMLSQINRVAANLPSSNRVTLDIIRKRIEDRAKQRCKQDPVPAPSDELFRQAARNGESGKLDLPADIEEQMRRDQESADREKKSGGHE